MSPRPPDRAPAPQRNNTRSSTSVLPSNAPAAIAPARAAAFHILERVGATAAHSDDLLHGPAVSALSPEDRNLTTALVMGVLRWQLALDAAIRPMLQRTDVALPAPARLAMRLGLFQLRYLSRLPAHAVLHDSVELVRQSGAPGLTGVVNAVLRRALREHAAVSAEADAERAHPAWLVDRWRRNFGGRATARILRYDQAEPPGGELFAADAALEGLQIDDGSRLVAELAVAAAPAHTTRILDACAAPGGKTAVLAARLPHSELIAVDLSEKRLESMRRRLDALGLAHVRTFAADMTVPSSAPELAPGFDLILCDAPCSGTGTLARNPEIRHRLRESDLARQAERQRAIATRCLALLRPGGRLVYSTCSLEPEENEGVLSSLLRDAAVRELSVAPLLGQIPSLAPAQREPLVGTAVHRGRLRTLPGVQPCDGFFAAVVERNPGSEREP